jgi:ATP-dependent Clp protease ATP-binding subunit ClpA
MSENIKRMQNIVGSFMEKSLKIPAYEGFSKAACIALYLARDEARRLHNAFVDEESILLGLISEEHGVASQTLRAQGITLKNARSIVEKLKGKGGGFKADVVPFSPRADSILEKAQLQAKKMYQSPIDTEHLLLALIDSSDGKGTAVQILEQMGVDCDMLRSTITGNFDE